MRERKSDMAADHGGPDTEQYWEDIHHERDMATVARINK
jgi:hypothetical protein